MEAPHQFAGADIEGARIAAGIRRGFKGVRIDSGDIVALSKEVRQMLDLYDLGDGRVTQLRVALGKFKERIGRLQHQKSEIERAIVELSRASEAVETMLAARGQART